MSARARSRRELAARLARKGFAAVEVAAALDRLADLGYLDDRKFASDRAQSLLQSGRLGPAGVGARLRAHGLTEAQVQAAVTGAVESVSYDARAAAQALLDKRGLSAPRSAKQKGRAARLLKSRGFSDDVVERLVGDPSLETLPEDD